MDIKYIRAKDLKGWGTKKSGQSRFVLSRKTDGTIRAEDKSGFKLLHKNYNWEALEESIETHGFINPLKVLENNGLVYDGNHRHAMAIFLYSPEKELPCVFTMPGSMNEDYIAMEIDWRRKQMEKLKKKPNLAIASHYNY